MSRRKNGSAGLLQELQSQSHLGSSKEVIVQTLKIKGASAQPAAKLGLQQTESCVSSF